VLVAPYGASMATLYDPALLALPFTVPEGHGVHVVYNTPALWREKREIFELPDEDADPPLNLSWFLPNGCFLEENAEGEVFPNCFVSDTLVAPVATPGVTYYVAVFDPDGTPQDYTLNMGIDESHTVVDEEIQDFVRDKGHLHRPCTEPYRPPPWRRWWRHFLRR
jgi:hypothetical protein